MGWDRWSEWLASPPVFLPEKVLVHTKQAAYCWATLLAQDTYIFWKVLSCLLSQHLVSFPFWRWKCDLSWNARLWGLSLCFHYCSSPAQPMLTMVWSSGALPLLFYLWKGFTQKDTRISLLWLWAEVSHSLKRWHPKPAFGGEWNLQDPNQYEEDWPNRKTKTKNRKQTEKCIRASWVMAAPTISSS